MCVYFFYSLKTNSKTGFKLVYSFLCLQSESIKYLVFICKIEYIAKSNSIASVPRKSNTSNSIILCISIINIHAFRIL